jgi:hypothetical protein
MLSRKAKLKRDKIKRYKAKHTASAADDVDGEGLADIFSSIGRAASSAAKTVGPALSKAASAVGSVAKAAAPHVTTAIKYVGKHTDDWAPSVMNGVSQLVAAKMRSKAMDINKEAEKLLASREAERVALNPPKDELSHEEIDRLLHELSGGVQGHGLDTKPKKQSERKKGKGTHDTKGFIPSKHAAGLYLPGTTNAPVSSATMQGLYQTVQGNGLEPVANAVERIHQLSQPCYMSSRPGIIKF